MSFFKSILSILLVIFVIPSVNILAMPFDELHIGGAADVKMVNNQDSAGHVMYNPQSAVDVKRIGNAIYITAKSASTPVSRVEVTVYFGSDVKVIEVSGRSRLYSESLKSPDQLSLVASGAAVLNLVDIAAANVNVSLSGSGSIIINGELTASTLNFSLVGSGTVKADLITASRMTISQRGSGKMIFGGSARDCDAVGRGTGSIDLRALVAGNMTLKLYGEGRIYYPAGVRVTTAGDTGRIMQVKPYQPL